VVGTDRNGLVDYGRFLAALGIVWFQSQAPGSRIAYIALPFFLVLLSRPSSATVVERAQRLLVPFVTWSLIFAILRTAMAVKHNGDPFGWWNWTMLVSGTWLHLWVLPFAFVAALLAPWFQHPLASMGAAFLAALLMSINGEPNLVPFGQWSFGIIPVLVGIAFFSWGWRLAVITLLGSWLILQFGRPSVDNVTILIGTALALACLSFRLPGSALSDWCARLAVGIYLAHPLVIIVGQSLRITWIELGLFSLIGSVLLALILETAVQASRKVRLEF
jgi:hypothetical protein